MKNTPDIRPTPVAHSYTETFPASNTRQIFLCAFCEPTSPPPPAVILLSGTSYCPLHARAVLQQQQQQQQQSGAPHDTR